MERFKSKDISIMRRAIKKWATSNESPLRARFHYMIFFFLEVFLVLVSFRLHFWFVLRFLSNICFIHKFPCFLRRVISLLTSPCGIACAVCKWVEVEVGGGMGSYGWCEGILGFTRKFLLARDLMYQLDSQFRVPVRLPVPQGTGESISADHTWVKYRNSNWDLTVYPDLHVQTGFIHYCCHNLTQLREYDQVLPP